jgi:hypothetical protein
VTLFLSKPRTTCFHTLSATSRWPHLAETDLPKQNDASLFTVKRHPRSITYDKRTEKNKEPLCFTTAHVTHRSYHHRKEATLHRASTSAHFSHTSLSSPNCLCVVSRHLVWYWCITDVLVKRHKHRANKDRRRKKAENVKRGTQKHARKIAHNTPTSTNINVKKKNTQPTNTPTPRPQANSGSDDNRQDFLHVEKKTDSAVSVCVRSMRVDRPRFFI